MATHRTLRVVTEEYEAFRFNTMVAHLMELTNTLFRYRGTEVAGGPAWNEAIRLLLLMLAPAAPHVTEELWSRIAADGSLATSIHTQSWPEVDAGAIADETREVPVQINGKVRDRVVVPAGTDTPSSSGSSSAGSGSGELLARPDAGAGDPRRRPARQHRRPGLTRSPALGAPARRTLPGRCASVSPRRRPGPAPGGGAALARLPQRRHVAPAPPPGP